MLSFEFAANTIRSLFGELRMSVHEIESGNTQENGQVDSSIGKFQNEFLNDEVLDTLMEARSLSRAGEGNTIASGRIAL